MTNRFVKCSNLTIDLTSIRQSPYRLFKVKMSSKVKKKILKLKESSTLVINEKSKELISKEKSISIWFWAITIPSARNNCRSTEKNAHRKEYLPIQGLSELEKIFPNIY